jgi:hypothetical protein
MKSIAIICLLFGLVTLDQIDKVGAIRIAAHKHNHKHRRNKLHNNYLSYDPEAEWNLQTEYESPFGLDSTHGFGGGGQKKLESQIDLGEVDSNEE